MVGSDRDRELAFTLWPTAKPQGGVGIVVRQPWSYWWRALAKHDRRHAKDGPCVTVALIPTGARRSNATVEHVDALCLDIDSGTEAEIFGALQNFARYEYALHTTHSHGSPRVDKHKQPILDPTTGRPQPQTKVRAVFPLARSISPEEWRRIFPAFSAMARGLQDPNVAKLSQPFYLPSAPPNAPNPLTFRNRGDWLNPDDLLAKSTTTTSSTSSDPLDSIVLASQVQKLAAKLRRMSKDHDLREAATQLLAGEPFAERPEKPGDRGRHETIIKLTGWLAFTTQRNPPSPEVVEALFAPSISAMQALDSDCDGLDAVVGAYETALAKAAELADAELNKAQADAAGDVAPMWTAEALERCAKAQGVEVKQIAYLVQRDRAHYVLQPDGSFAGPFVKDDVLVEIYQALGHAPVRLYEQKGDDLRPVPFVELVRKHGQIATEVVADLVKQKTHYDRPSRRLYEATRPLRTSELGEPYFDPRIDEWLALFAGDEQRYNKLSDWLACVADLDKLLCAINIAGDPGAGKTLFAQGVASLWARNGAPASAETILGRFNEDLARCPVVFADESLPRSFTWQSVTAKLRGEIGIVARTLNRKYLAPVELYGAVRFILAANNTKLLRSEIATAADLQAIAIRFLYISPTSDAERYLNKIDTDTKNRWRESGIPRHALWLRQNREVKQDGRFWVTGTVQRMHRLLMTSGDWNSWICEWVVKGLLDRFRRLDHSAETSGRVIIRNETLYVNQQAITEGWSVYTNYQHISPDPRHVATALRSLSTTDKQVQLKPTMFRYFKLDLGFLVAWAEENGVCGQSEIERAIANGLAERPKVVNIEDHRPRQAKEDP